MRIDVWADLVCPWCYLGKRRLEAALADFDPSDQVEVVWHSFQLDSAAPGFESGREPVSAAVHLGEKFGGGPDQIREMQQRVSDLALAEGMVWDHHHSPYVNSLDAHRLVHLARNQGGPGQASELLEALFAAYFADARDIADPEVLREIGVAAGLDAALVADMLAGQEYAEEVRADQQQAAALGATGVPFFVLAERYALSGAQPTEVFASAVNQAWAEIS